MQAIHPMFDHGAVVALLVAGVDDPDVQSQ